MPVPELLGLVEARPAQTAESSRTHEAVDQARCQIEDLVGQVLISTIFQSMSMSLKLTPEDVDAPLISKVEALM
jgi:hypothetical protein